MDPMTNAHSYMDEAPEPDTDSDGEPTTAPIANLAEDIVEAISEADQDWQAIERRVRELMGLVERRAQEARMAQVARKAHGAQPPLVRKPQVAPQLVRKAQGAPRVARKSEEAQKAQKAQGTLEAQGGREAREARWER